MWCGPLFMILLNPDDAASWDPVRAGSFVEHESDTTEIIPP